MKLAKKFKFLYAGRNTLYTAEQIESGDYSVTWGETGRVDYDAESVKTNIVNGNWRVTEVTQPFPVADKLTIACLYGGNVYRLERRTEKEYDIIASDGTRYNYTELQVLDFIARGLWIEQKPTVAEVVLQSLEVGDDTEVPTWPFPLTTKPTFEEPEFLPPDDIEPLPDYGISLLDIRKFCTDTDWSVTVDTDFYSLTFDGEVNYTVKTEAELAAVMQAVRTLAKYSDKG